MFLLRLQFNYYFWTRNVTQFPFDDDWASLGIELTTNEDDSVVVVMLPYSVVVTPSMPA